MLSNNTKAFFELVRAGLWEKDVQLSQYGEIDYNEVYRLAEEQSVVGLVAAGLEHIEDVKPTKEIALQFVGQTLQLEQQNQAMNAFIGKLVDKMREADIYTLLVKGQGVAQCYERPLWRACGDVDFLLSDTNYERAKVFLQPLSIVSEPESGKHIGMLMGSWLIELHGWQRCGLSNRIDRIIDAAQKSAFYNGDVRSWMNGEVQISLPGVNSDIFFIFTHFLKHFYKGGLGLRQICDWCRLLWTYKDSLNHGLLKSRLQKMRLMTEWKAFGAFAVDYLGLPSQAMPFYSPSNKWINKANRICFFVLMVGNMGHNRDLSGTDSQPFIIRKTKSFGIRMGDLIRHARIFPLDSLRFFPKIMLNGLRSAAKGIG